MQEDYTEIGDRRAVALVRRVRAGNGVRLEVYSPETDRRVYLDPLVLESLSWQTEETFSDTLESPPAEIDTTEVAEERVTAGEEYTEFSNEFAVTLVRRTRVGDGARLEVLSPKLGYQAYLEPSLLACLTLQTPGTLSRFLEEPYGPQGTH